MRKNNKIIVMVFAIIMTLMILIPNVQARTINTLNATESNGKISVSGTVENGVLAVAIVIYDSTESNLITMQTTSVKNDNTYSETIPVASGTYVVKVADYDGGAYITKKVTQDTTKEDDKTDTNTTTENATTDSNTIVENTISDAKGTNTKPSNPKTGDNIMIFVIIFAIATIGLFITIKLNKNRKQRKH